MSVQDQSFLAQRLAAERALATAPAIAPLFLGAGMRGMLRVANVRSSVRLEVRARVLYVGSDAVEELVNVLDFAPAAFNSLDVSTYQFIKFDLLRSQDAYLLDCAVVRTDQVFVAGFEAGATWVELFYGRGGSATVETDGVAEGGRFVILGRLVAGYSERNKPLFWPGPQYTRQDGTQSAAQRLLNLSTANASSNPYWLMLAPHGLLGVQLIGAGGFDGSVTFEGSLDGANWVPVRATRVSDGAVASVAVAPSNEIWQLDTAGLLFFRVTVAGRTVGTITVFAVSHRV